MRRLLPLLVFTLAIAFEAVAQDGRELSDEARARYAKSLREAAQLVQNRRFDDAKTALDALIAQRPREPQARFLKGIVQTETGAEADATATFIALTEEYPELPEPHNNLAVIYAKRGDLDGARVELETAIKTAPDWPVAHENLGDLHARIAAEHYDRAAKLDRTNKSAETKLELARKLFAPVAMGTTPAAK